MTHSNVIQQLTNAVASRITTDSRDKHRLDTQSPQVRNDISYATQHRPIGNPSKDRNWRLTRNARHLACHETVEDHVSDAKNPNARKINHLQHRFGYYSIISVATWQP